MSDDARNALRGPLGKLSFVDWVVLIVQVTVAFGLYFFLCMVAAYLFSLLVQERFDGGILLTGAAVGLLAGFVAGRNTHYRFGLERGDTHGSARFATSGEVRADLAGDTGLIVGRDSTAASCCATTASSPRRVRPMAPAARIASRYRHGALAGKAPFPVLFVLDEFAALGRLEPVERAFADGGVRHPTLAYPPGH